MSRLLLFLYAAQAIAAVDFARDVEPILTARCHGCHGERTQMKGLRLDNRDDALRVLSPGKSAESLLLRMVSGTEEKRVMPPAGARLTSTEIARLREWIDEGAVWPKVTTASPAKNRHWSFQPIARMTPPATRHQTWVRNPIDQFILARLERDGWEASPDASMNRQPRRSWRESDGG